MLLLMQHILIVLILIIAVMVQNGVIVIVMMMYINLLFFFQTMPAKSFLIRLTCGMKSSQKKIAQIVVWLAALLLPYQMN
ncbi:hypothetical protein EDJ07_23725 [Salmonella enterica]|nr:hypothetical protein [Salmonella enterica]EAB4146259.1 hypothetical protein [Salmonella enterica]EAM1341327.1 hypothetical protein [Salmonella enterica]EAN0799102.1 hypothetical protein [Salmonella enterica]EAN8380664.1 hypothetical protein [Salmonella enterica]